MKIVFKFFIFSLLFCTILTSCTQKNYNGTVKNDTDIKSFVAAPTPTDLVNNSYYRIIEFASIPSADDQAVLRSPGIKILEYIPENAYLVEIATDFKKEILLNTAAQFIRTLSLSDKVNNQLQNWNIPTHAQAGSKAKVAVVAMKALLAKDFQSDLKAVGLTVDSYGGDPRFAYLTLSEAEMKKVAELPWVRYIELIDEEGTPETEGGK